jgi:hypothetical protein
MFTIIELAVILLVIPFFVDYLFYFKWSSIKVERVIMENAAGIITNSFERILPIRTLKEFDWRFSNLKPENKVC